MSDNTTVTSQTPSTSVTPASSPAQTRGVSGALIICALGVIGSFFLPFIRLFGGLVGATGAAMITSKEAGDQGRMLMMIPMMAGITIITGVLAPKLQRVFAVVTGILPLAAFGYYYNRFGSELIEILGSGAYFCLLMGAALLVLSMKSED